MRGISQSMTKPGTTGSDLLSVGVLTLATELHTEESSVKPRKDFQRLPQLDTLRGFLLVWMTLTHLPTHISPYSNQMVGCVSAAEGFILLAAILVGRVQQGASERYGRSVAREKLWRRIVRIYGYHLVLLGFAFSICAAAAGYFHRVPLQNLLDFYLQHPKAALIAAPALLLQSAASGHPSDVHRLHASHSVPHANCETMGMGVRCWPGVAPFGSWRSSTYAGGSMRRHISDFQSHSTKQARSICSDGNFYGLPACTSAAPKQPRSFLSFEFRDGWSCRAPR